MSFPPLTSPPLLMLSVLSILHSAAGTIQLCWYYSAFLWLSVPSILHISNMLLLWYYSTSLLLSVSSILHSAANIIPHHPFYASPICCWYGTIPLLSCYLCHLFYTVVLVLFCAILIYMSLTCQWYGTILLLSCYLRHLIYMVLLVLFRFSLVIRAIYSKRLPCADVTIPLLSIHHLYQLLSVFLPRF